MNHKCNRDMLQKPFLERLSQLGIDGYGNFHREDFKKSILYEESPKLLDFLTNCQKSVAYPSFNPETTSYINNEFHVIDPDEEEPILIIRPFDWSDNLVLRYIPNFQASTEDNDIAIWWYKYALRAATSEYELTLEKIHHYFNSLEETIIRLADK